jgi:hypothetical protein
VASSAAGGFFGCFALTRYLGGLFGCSARNEYLGSFFGSLPSMNARDEDAEHLSSRPPLATRSARRAHRDSLELINNRQQ